MNSMFFTRTAVALAAALWLAPAAHAGRSCEQRPLTLQALTQGLALAQHTALALDAEFARSCARVVVLGSATPSLESWHAAEPDIATRTQAQAWLGFKTYQPTTLRLGAFTRLGASAGSAHIRFDDHPNDKRFSDRIETVTVDSVLDWLERTGLGGPAQRLAL